MASSRLIVGDAELNTNPPTPSAVRDVPTRLSVIRVAPLVAGLGGGEPPGLGLGAALFGGPSDEEDENDGAADGGGAARWPRVYHYDVHSPTHLNLRESPSTKARSETRMNHRRRRRHRRSRPRRGRALIVVRARADDLSSRFARRTVCSRSEGATTMSDDADDDDDGGSSRDPLSHSLAHSLTRSRDLT